MLNIDDVNATIRELESGNTTFDTCMKLASLYIVREKFGVDESPVEQEVQEILPQYREYCKVKRKYQMKEIGENMMFESMQLVCNEINGFIHILYSSTDTNVERALIRDMLSQVLDTLN